MIGVTALAQSGHLDDQGGSKLRAQGGSKTRSVPRTIECGREFAVRMLEEGKPLGLWYKRSSIRDVLHGGDFLQTHSQTVSR